jgi:hypothetical protein
LRMIAVADVFNRAKVCPKVTLDSVQTKFHSFDESAFEREMNSGQDLHFWNCSQLKTISSVGEHDIWGQSMDGERTSTRL